MARQINPSLLVVILLPLIAVLTTLPSLVNAEDPSQPLYPCAQGWARNLIHLWRASRKWARRGLANQCYDFVYIRSFRLPPDYRGPFAVSVRSGRVVRNETWPDELFIPTMPAIFQQIKDECFAACPNDGPARCDVTYDPTTEDFVQDVYIDLVAQIVDEEISYSIANLTFCE